MYVGTSADCVCVCVCVCTSAVTREARPSQRRAGVLGMWFETLPIGYKFISLLPDAEKLLGGNAMMQREFFESHDNSRAQWELMNARCELHACAVDTVVLS